MSDDTVIQCKLLVSDQTVIQLQALSVDTVIQL